MAKKSGDLPKVAWVSSWDRQCGIADYSKALLPRLEARGVKVELISLDRHPNAESLAWAVAGVSPDLVHIQHEYGLYGGKRPDRYWFPKFLKLAQKRVSTRWVATAHTVLNPKFTFPLRGRHLQIPFRMTANALFLPWLKGKWGKKTWGGLDGVICHSRFQEEALRHGGAKQVFVIPHFVFDPPAQVKQEMPLRSEWLTGFVPKGRRLVTIFGFLTPEKGQDVALEALAKIPKEMRPFLLIAGGVRRKTDQFYHEDLRKIVKALSLEGDVRFTGFVPPTEVNGVYANSEMVLAPFRETSGSGSLAQALARGVPILASDLPLNSEINARVPGTLQLFKAGDPADLARIMTAALVSPQGKGAGQAYAKANSLDAIAEMHHNAYLKSGL